MAEERDWAMHRTFTSHNLDYSAEANKDFYAAEARNYNNFVRIVGPGTHEFTADFVALVSRSKGLREPLILDLGCGTGLIGEMLSERGLRRLHGWDLSPEMTAVAEETGVYEQLRSGVDLNAAIPDDEEGHYDLAVASGLLCHGHVKAEQVPQLLRLLRVGGLLIASTRLSFMKATGLEALVEGWERQGLFTTHARLRGAAYALNEGADYWAFQRL